MDIVLKILSLWPLGVAILLALVFIRLGRSPKAHGDKPPDSTGGYDP